MPLITDSHDSLQYIDTELTPQQRDAAQAEITSLLPPTYSTEPHPSLPPAPSPNFTPLAQSLIDAKAANPETPLAGGIDTSRYQSLDAPEVPPADADADTRAAALDAYRSTLRQAYASSTHIETRLTNLNLLEQFGKNAWLVGNAQLEDVLRGLEREISGRRDEVDRVERERRERQEGVRGEVEALEEAWREGVGRVIETEVAAEGLRREVLERRREAALQQ
ncbi:MAG: hypothetical protein M4579_006597 [Chaenotheca gracillima]|nr:MAG: hypothetical protein M4579_006597 [Chaenotheca gracillima]